MIEQQEEQQPPNSKEQWNICTHNVQGINEKIKQTLLLDFCKEQHIDLLGINETWLNPNNKWRDPENKYKIILSTTSQQIKGSGVGFIITNRLAPHIYNTQEHNNRGMFIELAFRGNIKYHIINIYKPSNISNKQEIKNLFNWLKTAISQAISKISTQ